MSKYFERCILNHLFIILGISFLSWEFFSYVLGFIKNLSGILTIYYMVRV